MTRYLQSVALTILCVAACECASSANLRQVRGTYRNPALGYSIEVPRGLSGIAGDEDGPERGIRISLPSGGVLTVWAEPNSLEWKTPAEGLRYDMSAHRCAGVEPEILPARLGVLKGVTGRLVCGGRVLRLVLAFRSSGGLIYWVRLETTPANEKTEEAVLGQFTATFKVIRWE